MVYKRFSIGLTLRIVLIVILSLSLVLCIHRLDQRHFASIVWWILSSIFFVCLLAAGISLYEYTNSANRKLALFFESTRYDDFSIRFTADKAMGKSFRELNHQLHQMQEAFKQVRAENEASLYLMKNIIGNIQTGLLVFDSFGRIEVINNAARELLGYHRLKNINELNNTHPGLAEKIMVTGAPSSQFLYRTAKNQELAMNILPLVIREQEKTLVAFQNISEELQRKEVEAWQHLTRVLRHEIMNSLTPVLSLIGTMKYIVMYELTDKRESGQAWRDLLEALETIELRGKGMIDFVEGYRHFANIPLPKLSLIQVQPFIYHVKKLLQPEVETAGIVLICDTPRASLYIKADTEQLTMVLINIVKNAREALDKTHNPEIHIRVYPSDDQVTIEVADNGTGIEAEALKDIFIPFYSTKKEGVGIGLSLSRQIIQHHGGTLRAESEPGKGSRFFIVLNQVSPPDTEPA